MKKFTLVDLLALLIGLIPIGYLLYVYASLPAIVPMHYGADGTPNAFGPKSELFIVQSILTGTSFLLYLLMKFLPSIDPKKQVKNGEKTFQKLGLGLIIFLAALSICITFATINKSFKIDKLILPLIGFLFVFLGNLMYNIKPNYFAGVRTPWTLEDEGNWRATHRLAGKVWVTGGIIITVAMLLLPSPAATFVFLPCILVMSFIPIVYSYIYFKKHQIKI
ncbi:SdpI family protein [Mucilaginibacter sp.]|uniref:SdpI family protein n=1 Tax=Mucilaginibacter sp. TaxID=1882438 RepID=UPI003D11EB41